MPAEQLQQVADALESCLADNVGDGILEYFRFTHLPPHLQLMSAVFARAAADVCRMAKRNPERTVALRKLLEGKDAAVRACL